MIRLQASIYEEKLELFDEIASTQDYLKELYSNKSVGQNFHWVRAHFQSKGRGRLGRSWESKKGTSLLCSVAFDSAVFEEAVMLRVEFLPFVALVALCEVLEANHGNLLPFFVKWPNDLMCFKGAEVKKLSGLLVESKGGKFFVVGWGLNLRGESEVPTAISLEEALKTKIEDSLGDKFYGELRQHFYTQLKSWIADQESFEKNLIETLQKKWMKDFWRRQVRVGDTHYEALGLDPSGSLRCRNLGTGKVESISSAHGLEIV